LVCGIVDVLVLMVVMMGRWSDAKFVVVRQVVSAARFEDMVVISGEVGCCKWLEGTLVGVSWLRII